MSDEQLDHVTKQRDAAFRCVREMQDKLTKSYYDHTNRQLELESTIKELRQRVERMSRSGNTLSRALWLVDYQAHSPIINDWEDAKHFKPDA
jgi:hypothetical protein